MTVMFSGRGMDRLGGADGGQVAVALVGEDDVVRQRALDAGRDSRRAAVGGLDHVAVELIIRQNGAADRRDADGVAQHAQFLQALGHQAVDNAVGASRAVMGLLVGQTLGFLKNNRHNQLAPPTIFSISARTSAGLGIMPPVRPKKPTGQAPLTARRTSSTICPMLISTPSMALTLPP